MNIRLAHPADSPTIVEFNCAMAWETESIRLLPDVIAAGVQALLETPNHGFYLLAEIEGDVVGMLMITTEWSDWRNGLFWWVQSVYVRPELRRRGIYRSLYAHVKKLAADDPEVCGFRLYVERENRTAQQTYSSLGMRETRYSLYEELLPDQRFAEETR